MLLAVLPPVMTIKNIFKDHLVSPRKGRGNCWEPLGFVNVWGEAFQREKWAQTAPTWRMILICWSKKESQCVWCGRERAQNTERYNRRVPKHSITKAITDRRIVTKHTLQIEAPIPRVKDKRANPNHKLVHVSTISQENPLTNAPSFKNSPGCMPLAIQENNHQSAFQKHSNY